MNQSFKFCLIAFVVLSFVVPIPVFSMEREQDPKANSNNQKTLIRIQTAEESPAAVPDKKSPPVIETNLPGERIIDLTGGTYFETISDSIARAEESLFIVMPRIQFSASHKDSRVTQLMKDLVRAKRRGVFVFVLLELTNRLQPESQDAFFFLNDNGIDVHYEDLDEKLATKFVVIDKEVIISGSSEWTEEALRSDHQLDTLRYSKNRAEEMVSFVQKMKYFENPLELEYYNQLYLDPSFAYHPNGFSAFYERQDKEALSFYLLLLRRLSKESQSAFVTVNAEEIANEFGLSKKAKIKGGDFRKVRGLLERLQETYVLISFEQISSAPDYKVKFLSLEDSDSLKLPFTEGIRISDAFFEAGWYEKLSLPAIYCYLFLLSLESEEGYGAWFLVSQESIKQPRSMPQNKYIEGIRELRAENLISVEYLDSENTSDLAYFDFQCLIMVPYFEDWYQSKIAELLKRYPARRVNQALQISESMLRRKDIQTVEKIISLGEHYSSSQLDKIFEKRIKPLEPENPYKSLPYFISYLEKEA